MDTPPEDFSKIYTIIIGPVVAFFFSIIRTLYDSTEPRPVRIALEAGICAGITVTAMATAMAAIEYFSLSFAYETVIYISAGIGSFVGWIGANEIRKAVLANLPLLRKKESDE